MMASKQKYQVYGYAMGFKVPMKVFSTKAAAERYASKVSKRDGGFHIVEPAKKSNPSLKQLARGIKAKFVQIRRVKNGIRVTIKK